MLIPDALEELFDALKEAKEGLVAATPPGGDDDMEPAILVFFDETFEPITIGDIIGLCAEAVGSSGQSPIPPAVYLAIMGLRAAMRAADVAEPIVAVAIATEAHFRTVSTDDPDGEMDSRIASYRHGDMAREYKENPVTDVREALNMAVIEADLCGGWNTAVVMQEFSRADGGGLAWGKRYNLPADVEHSTVIDAAIRAAGGPIPDFIISGLPGESASAVALPVEDIVAMFRGGGMIGKLMGGEPT